MASPPKGLNSEASKLVHRVLWSVFLKSFAGCKGVKQEVWYYRFYEPGTDGRRHRRNVKVGTRQQYPTEALAMRLWMRFGCLSTPGSLNQCQ